MGKWEEEDMEGGQIPDNDLSQVLGIRSGRKDLVENEPGLPVYVGRYSCIESWAEI